MITLIIGPMYSGKTTEVLRQLERAYLGKKAIVLVRPLSDTRLFLTHASIDANWLETRIVSDLEQEEFGKKIEFFDYDVIGIDEGQFHKSLVEFCTKHSLMGKDIIVSALHATSESQMFDNIVELIPHCDRIIKLNAVCMECGSDNGSYTYHTNGKKTAKVEVGGADKYIALCRKCYFDKHSG